MKIPELMNIWSILSICPSPPYQCLGSAPDVLRLWEFEITTVHITPNLILHILRL